MYSLQRRYEKKTAKLRYLFGPNQRPKQGFAEVLHVWKNCEACRKALIGDFSSGRSRLAIAGKNALFAIGNLWLRWSFAGCQDLKKNNPRFLNLGSWMFVCKYRNQKRQVLFGKRYFEPRNFSQLFLSLEDPSSSSDCSAGATPESLSASSHIDCVIAAFLALSSSGTPLFRHSEMTP